MLTYHLLRFVDSQKPLREVSLALKLYMINK